MKLQKRLKGFYELAMFIEHAGTSCYVLHGKVVSQPKKRKKCASYIPMGDKTSTSSQNLTQCRDGMKVAMWIITRVSQIFKIEQRITQTTIDGPQILRKD